MAINPANNYRFLVKKVTVNEIGGRGLRETLGKISDASKVRGEIHSNTVYQIFDQDKKQQFEFTGRLDEEGFNPERIQKLLIHNARSISFVSPPVLDEATKVVNKLFNAHPELVDPQSPSYRLSPYETPSMSFENLKFTCNPTDVMFYAVWRKGDPLPRIEDCLYPYGEFTISPNAQILHYCSEEFDGLLGITGIDKKFALFRPDWGIRREILSGQRACFAIAEEVQKDNPLFTYQQLFDFLMQIRVRVALENRRVWPKSFEEGRLYLRPFMFDSGKILGVDVTGEITIIVLGHPAGAYYTPGKSPVDEPISLWASTIYHRGAPGMSSYVKLGSNYAQTIKAKKEAKAKGHKEVLYLDPTNKFVNEIGSANCGGIKKISKDKYLLIVPPYSDNPAEGIVLNGGTINSVITDVEKFLGWGVEVRPFPIEELLTCDEVIACGTAASVTAIKEIEFEGKPYYFNKFEATKIIYDRITGIQSGRHPDIYNWRHIIG